MIPIFITLTDAVRPVAYRLIVVVLLIRVS